MVPRQDIQLPPVVDLEYVGNSKKRPSVEDFQKELRDFLKIIEGKFGRKPLFYTTYDFAGDYLKEDFTEYDIWVRDVFSHPDEEVYPEWVIWQYTPKGRVNGIVGDVDLNVLRTKDWLDISLR